MGTREERGAQEEESQATFRAPQYEEQSPATYNYQQMAPQYGEELLITYNHQPRHKGSLVILLASQVSKEGPDRQEGSANFGFDSDKSQASRQSEQGSHRYSVCGNQL